MSDLQLLPSWVYPIALLACCCAVRSHADDDWPRYAHDAALTSRTSLQGDITRPRVAWTFSTAGREVELEFIPTPGTHHLAISATEGSKSILTPSLEIPGPQLRDIDGTGVLRSTPESYHERWAKVLPDTNGMQRVAWSHTWTTEKVCRLRLFAYDDGYDKPRKVWESDPPEETIFSPLNIVYDIDGDGIQEICVAAHYRLMIYEGTTGRKETELRYHTSRPYGWFGLVDLDGDDQVELITIGDFQSHIDVLTYDRTKPEGDRLAVKWRRDIETDIAKREKWPRVGPHPVIDVTGDGRPEIVVSLFNDTGDKQWHTQVIDALSGEVIDDLPRRFLSGVADVDRDGTAELFVTASRGVFIPTLGRIELLRMSRGPQNLWWAHDNAGWFESDLRRLGATWSTSATQGMRQVLTTPASSQHGPAFLVRIRDPDAPTLATLQAKRCDAGGRPKTVWKVDQLEGEFDTMALGDGGEPGQVAARVKVALQAGKHAIVTGTDVEPRLVKDAPLGLVPSPPIAARLRRGGPMTVIVEGAGEQTLALQPPDQPDEQPRLAWQTSGRGMADGSRRTGPLAIDLDGDGGCEVVVASQSADGSAVLSAIRHDGRLFWDQSFDETPGAVPAGNIGGLMYWWPGHFRDSEETDLFVNTRQGFMHSGRGHLLSGRSGSIHWTQTKAEAAGEFSWGYAGIPVAVADADGDHRDELISLYPVCFWIADGRTGQITAGKDLASRKELPAWAAYGEPMVHDFNGDGRPEVLLDSPYILALLDTDGRPIWHGLGRDDYPTSPDKGNVGEVTPTKHALIDFDGDGTCEIASAGYGDGVRAIDPASGTVLWSFAAPAPTCGRVAAADIDGQVGDELLYVTGRELIAITGDRERGRLLWTWKGPASLSLPAIADTDDDGFAEIIVQDGQGTVHCLDGTAGRQP